MNKAERERIDRKQEQDEAQDRDRKRRWLRIRHKAARIAERFVGMDRVKREACIEDIMDLLDSDLVGEYVVDVDHDILDAWLATVRPDETADRNATRMEVKHAGECECDRCLAARQGCDECGQYRHTCSDCRSIYKPNQV